MYVRNPRHLAALLRGDRPKFEAATWASAAEAQPRGGLPRALALWQSQRAAREAEELRRATTPRAWVDGQDITPNTPSVESASEEPTAPDAPQE